MVTHLGIDYGSKLAGTTSVCWMEHDKLSIKQSSKKENADEMIEDLLNHLKPEFIFIDCPLTLPSAYYGEGDDFFYRRCDKELRAMSPMFLGGLTARGMRLKHKCKSFHWHEVYPKALVEHFNLHETYQKKNKNDIQAFIENLNTCYSFNLLEKIETWHSVDSLLAWISGSRYLKKQHHTIGTEKEGLIII